MRTAGWLSALVLSGACSFSGGAAGIDGGQVDARDPDAGGPTDPDAPDGPPGPTEVCFGGGGLAEVCFPAPLADALIIDQDRTIATPGDCPRTQVQASGEMLCVLAGSRVVISARLRATGPLPLVIASASTIEISGDIDVASKRTDPEIGAGGNTSLCGAPTNGGANNGGGAGGTFGGRGGAGAVGNNGAGSPGGTAVDPVPISVVRGGCPGTAGNAGGGGAGARGGGAVYLIAETSIAISGRINASGAGASGGGGGLGAGGGGSGGLIGLDAPSVANTGRLWANGGGGGEGGGIMNGNSGTESAGPDGAGSTGEGGRGNTNGGNGGNGSLGTRLDGDGGATDAGGGGGGGGGAGRIRVFPPQAIAGAVSPAAS